MGEGVSREGRRSTTGEGEAGEWQEKGGGGVTGGGSQGGSGQVGKARGVQRSTMRGRGLRRAPGES